MSNYTLAPKPKSWQSHAVIPLAKDQEKRFREVMLHTGFLKMPFVFGWTGFTRFMRFIDLVDKWHDQCAVAITQEA